MAWYNSLWLKRKSHVINAATGAGASYQIKITVHKGTGSDSNGDVYLGTNVRDDFGDVRFTDDDGTTLLSYWMESSVSGTSAIFWVKVADSLESSNQTIYIYYNKTDGVTTSDPNATLIYYHDFEGETVDQPPTKFLDTTNLTIVDKTGEEGSRCVRYGVSGDGPFDHMDMADIAGLCINYKWKNFTPFQSAITIRHTSDADCIYIGGVYGNPANYFGIFSESGSDYTAFTYGTGWHDVQVTAYGGAISATIDATTTVNHTTTQLDAKKCTLRDWNSVTAYFDYIRIRKYCSPEPAHSTWGSEETESTTWTKSLTQTFIIATSESSSMTHPLTQSLTVMQILSSLFHITLMQTQQTSDSFLYLARKISEEISSLADSIIHSFSLALESTFNISDIRSLLDSIHRQETASLSDSLALIVGAFLEGTSSFVDSVLFSLSFNLKSILNTLDASSFLDSIGRQEIALLSDSVTSSVATFLEEMSSFLEEMKVAFSLSLQSSMNITKSLLLRTSTLFSELLGVSVSEENLSKFLRLSSESLGFVESREILSLFLFSENILHLSDISLFPSKVVELAINLGDNLSNNFLLFRHENFSLGEQISYAFWKLEESILSSFSSLSLKEKLDRKETASFFDYVTESLSRIFFIQAEELLSFVPFLSHSSLIFIDEILPLLGIVSKKFFFSINSTISFLDSVLAHLSEILLLHVEELLSTFSSVSLYSSSLALLNEAFQLTETSIKKFFFSIQSSLSFLDVSSFFKARMLSIQEMISFGSVITFSTKKVFQQIMNFVSQPKQTSRHLLLESFSILSATLEIFSFLTFIREIHTFLRNTSVYTKLRGYYVRIKKRDFGND